MKRVILLLFVFSLSSHLEASSDKIKLRDKKMMELLLQEEAIIQSHLRHKDQPKWRQRLMKLLIEKYDIVQRQENEVYLKSPMKIKMSKKKASFFKESKNIYREIRKQGLYILKKWPNYKGRAITYHNLAANSLRNNDPVILKNEFPQYLKKVLKLSKPRSKIAKSALTLLAEHYYKFKKYDVSVGYYNQLLKLERDQWATKHLFNLSWCLLQTGKPKKALSLIRQSLFLSRGGKTKKETSYIDYSGQVVKALPLFFERAGRVREGIDFFKKEKKNFHKNLLSLAGFARENGKYKDASYIYGILLADAKKKKNQDEVNTLLILQMDMALDFKDQKKFKTLSKLLADQNSLKKLSNKDRIDVLKKIKKYVSAKQKLLVKYKWRKSNTVSSILFYFDQMTKLDPENIAEYRYYQGEVLYSVKRYKDSFKYYFESVDFLKKRKDRSREDKKLLVKVFNSIFSVLDKAKFKRDLIYQKKVLAYKSYLKIFPKNKQSEKVYQRLFNIHYKKGDIDKAKVVLLLYAKHHLLKAQREKQQFMMTQILNHHIKKKNLEKISYWLDRLRKGFLGFRPDYLKEISKIRSEIILDEALKEKDLKVSNSRYRDIYEREDYSRLVRGKAAYYLAQNHLKTLGVVSSFIWLKNSLDIVEASDRDKFEEGALSSVQKMVYLQDFSHAHKLASYYFQKFCIQKKSLLKEDFYDASVVYAMMDKQYEEALLNLESFKRCNLPKKAKLKNLKYMAKFYFNHRNYRRLDDLFRLYEGERAFHSFFAQLVLSGYWDSLLQSSRDQENYFLSHLKTIRLKNIKSQEIKKEIRSVLKFNELKRGLAKEDINKFSLYDVAGKFNEDHFNKILDGHIVQLGEFTKKITRYINMGYPQIVFYGHSVLYRRYRVFGQALLDFRPRGVDENYKKSFVKAMSNLGRQFLQQANQQYRLGANFLKKEEGFFRESGQLLLSEDHVANQVTYRYPASLYGITLDKDKGKGK